MTVLFRSSKWNKHKKEERPLYRTLLDEERERAIEEKKKEKIYRLLGRRDNIPISMKGKKMNVIRINPEDLLIAGGYKKNGSRGWIKNLPGVDRFHAYFDPETGVLSLHRDTVHNGKHRAGDKGVLEEINRLSCFIPTRKEYLKKKNELEESKEK